MIVGRLVAFGPPFYRRLVQLAKLLLEQQAAGSRRLAWCLLSPLVSVTSLEPDLKAQVSELRKEFEKSDNVAMLTAQTRDQLLHPDAIAELTAVVAELGEVVKPIGRSMPEDVGGGIAKVGESTGVGKAFEQVAHQLGYSGAQLWRAHELSETVTVLNSEVPRVVVKTELLQLISGPELPYTFSYALELTRPGNRVLAALPEEMRGILIPALFGALSLGRPDPAAAELADQLRQRIDEVHAADWKARLEPLLSLGSPAEIGARWSRGVIETARRMALAAAPDLRLAARMLSRMDDHFPKPRMVARVDELDQAAGESAVLRDLLSFAASPEMAAFILV
jgi:hypothetical protein